MRCNFDGGVHTAGRRATNQQWDLALAEPRVFFHLHGDHLHFFKAWCDEARQPDDVCVFSFGGCQNVLPRHHDAHVHDVKVVALKHHGDDVFTDVVNVTFHGCNHDFALAAYIAASGFELFFLFFDVGDQVRYCLLHDARAFNHLR